MERIGTDADSLAWEKVLEFKILQEKFEEGPEGKEAG